MKSPLRWAGSKRQVLQQLKVYWPGDHVRYVEPFAGSASLFFDLEPSRAILGDLNQELIDALQAIQRDVRGVLEYLRGLPIGKRAYYGVRKVDPTSLCHVTAAARFLYLNRYCFNGLYRTNLRGDFNVPYGPPNSRVSFDEAMVNRAAGVLQHAQLIHSDFEATLERARAGDFVYLDPPYAVSSRRIFSEYGPGSFNDKDLDRLAGSLRKLDADGVTFVITYADSREARRLLKRWCPRRIWTRRNIAGFTSKRRGSYELLATNSPLGRTPDGN